jgi:hypothetical protein
VTVEPLDAALRHILGHGGRNDHRTPLCSDHEFSLSGLETLADDNGTTLLARIVARAAQQDVEGALAR